MAGRLQDKVIIVTGAAPRAEGVGNGMAMAVLAAREGAKVVLVNRSAERAEALRESIVAEGGEAMVFVGDVTKDEDTKAMVAAAEDAYGRLDGLVNNVGYGAPGSVEEIDEAAWDDIIEVNLKTAMLSTRAAIPAMKRAGGGSVVNISSIAGALGLMAETGSVAYSAAKGGLHGFTLSVAADFVLDRIRANCIIIGSVHTPLVERLGPAARERRAKMVPMETEGTAWDIGHGAVYLLSDESRWITGLMLPIDGGLIALRIWPR